MYLFLDIFLTFISYTIIPFFVFFRRKEKFDYKTKNIIIILNSVFISIFYISLRFALNFDEPIRSFTPAFLYYFVNIAIWNSNIIKNNKKIDFNKILKYIIPTVLIIDCLVYIIIFTINIRNNLDISNMPDAFTIPTHSGIWTTINTSKEYIETIKKQLIINNYILVIFMILNILSLSFMVNYIFKNKSKK